MRSTPLIHLALVSAALCVSPGFASADTIATCVSLSSGSISLTPTGLCGPKQQLVIWNVEGPQGPPGPSGPRGAAGPIGPSGVAGAEGSIGPTGATGPRGNQGPAGSTGPAGEIGSPGATGPVGERGPQGPSGVPGPAGVDGPQGIIGEVGPPGDPHEPAGPPGEPGPSGDGLPLAYDANGALIGKYFDSGAIVVSGNDRFFIGLERLGYRPVLATFYYFTADCSDAPYGRVQGSNFVPPMVTALAKGMAWVPQWDEMPLTIVTGQTYYTRDSTPNNPNADLTPCTARTQTSTSALTVFPFKGYDISGFVFPFHAVKN